MNLCMRTKLLFELIIAKNEIDFDIGTTSIKIFGS